MKTVAIAIMTMVLLLAAGYLLGAVLGLVFGLVSTAATKLLYLWNDDKFAPQRRGGRRVQEHEAPELVATLRDLARRAGIPVPNLYVIESPTKANALAAGRGRRHAAICVTTGLLHALSRDELAGVLAHELGHVLRRSAVIKTTAAVLGAAVSLLPPFGIFFGLGIGVSLLLMFAIHPLPFYCNWRSPVPTNMLPTNTAPASPADPTLLPACWAKSRSWTTRVPKIWRTAPWGERCSRSGDG